MSEVNFIRTGNDFNHMANAVASDAVVPSVEHEIYNAQIKSKRNWLFPVIFGLIAVLLIGEGIGFYLVSQRKTTSQTTSTITKETASTEPSEVVDTTAESSSETATEPAVTPAAESTTTTPATQENVNPATTTEEAPTQTTTATNSTSESQNAPAVATVPTVESQNENSELASAGTPYATIVFNLLAAVAIYIFTKYKILKLI